MPDRPYHHGDLRRALLDAALSLIGAQGVEALTLRAVAGKVGVTHAAPYRHFVDKGDLLAAVAGEGFKLLAERTEAARDAAGAALPDRLLAIGVAYVRFAVEHPAHYRVMFGRGLADLPEDHPFHTDAKRAFGVLTGTVGELQAAGVMSTDAPDARAVLGWSTVHGLAMLLTDGLLPLPPTPAARDAFVSGILMASYRGLLN